MQVELAAVEDAEVVAEMWVTLASEQRQYGSHVLSEPNRGVVRDEVTRHAVTDRLLVARREAEDGDGGDGDTGDGTSKGDGASEDTDVVGFAMVTIDRGSYEMAVTQGVVENLFVAPGHRNQGIGAALLEAAERRLARLGAETVTLEAMADNRDARRFYRRHGYDDHRVTLEKPLESDNHSKEGR